MGRGFHTVALCVQTLERIRGAPCYGFWCHALVEIHVPRCVSALPPPP